MVLPLTYIGDPLLYKKAKPVAPKEIMSAKIQTFLNDLGDTMKSISIAAGLAAPQVGKELRLFAIILDAKSLSYTVKKAPKTFTIPEREPFFFINPKLSFPTQEKVIKQEACLSIPHYYGDVERFKDVVVQAYDRNGVLFEIQATKFLSRLIQHEYDHLDGILWTQRVTDPKTIIYAPEKELE